MVSVGNFVSQQWPHLVAWGGGALHDSLNILKLLDIQLLQKYLCIGCDLQPCLCHGSVSKPNIHVGSDCSFAKCSAFKSDNHRSFGDELKIIGPSCGTASVRILQNPHCYGPKHIGLHLQYVLYLWLATSQYE